LLELGLEAAFVLIVLCRLLSLEALIGDPRNEP